MCGCRRTSILSIFPLLVIKKAILLLSEPSPRGFRAPDGGDHGKDQEADDHGFHSRHGPASPSSSPLPVLCLGMLWRTELAGCAQRDSAEPVKQSGVREGQRCRRSPLSLSLPQPWFRGRSMGSKLPSPSHMSGLQHGASRLHWIGTRAAAAVSGLLREKPELRASIIVINQVKTTYLWALYMP